MELKPYQQKLINDLSDFWEFLEKYKKTNVAFKAYWKSRGIPENATEAYKNNIPNCPHVCIKVPTAGGKTFIACNALRTIFDNMPFGKSKVVIWLVPSLTILEQTLKNLKDPNHPYCRKINSHFNSRVEVYDKKMLLQGTGFNPTSVKEQLSILVLSFDTFRSRKKEDRKIYQENSNLEEFPETYTNREKLLPDTDDTALINVINQLNPVCIVDESHNAETELSVEMLKNLNPSFILDLTATPKNNSNIISYVNSLELKKENMVKLPVIVYNQQSKTDVINSALELRRNLEEKAMAEEKQGGRYIRPIVLFQAQPKNDNDSTTFEKIKEKLINSGIAETHIAIKTAQINELGKWEKEAQGLLNSNCPVRYIITVNALKEGWDCPFAYILASLANRSSAVDVEQVLGRILRQPYVKKHKEPLLNFSYVFTASAKFLHTLDNIVNALNMAGFSSRDYRIAASDKSQNPIAGQEQFQITAFSESESEADDIDEKKINSDAEFVQKTVEAVTELALKENEKLAREIEKIEKNNEDIIPPELEDKVKFYAVKEIFREQAKEILLPNFFIEIPASRLFSKGEDHIFLTAPLLYSGFDLSKSDIHINFGSISSDMYKVDIKESEKDEYVPEYMKLKHEIKEEILRYISSLPEESQLKQFADIIFNTMKKLDTLPDRHIRDYILRVIKSLDPEQLSDLKQRPYSYAAKIKEKILSLQRNYAEEQFYKKLDTDKIFCKINFSFPPKISPIKTVSGITKGLYQEEDALNGFEHKIINEIANCENIRFWHKNIEKKGFVLNGFINHYPDFIVKTESNKILLIETKGNDRDNSDSKAKLKLGQAWANKAGEPYKYFMIFDDNPIEGAYSSGDFLEIVREI